MNRYGQALRPEAEGGFHDGDMLSASSFRAPSQGEWPPSPCLRALSAEENWSTLNHSVCWPCHTLFDPE